MEYTLPHLFKTLIDQGGSDLHIATNSPPRIRIDGQLIPLNISPLTPEESLSLCYSVLTEEQRKTFEQKKRLIYPFP